jgi:hypothetical protein
MREYPRTLALVLNKIVPDKSIVCLEGKVLVLLSAAIGWLRHYAYLAHTFSVELTQQARITRLVKANGPVLGLI